jgi:hypothetical protein
LAFYWNSGVPAPHISQRVHNQIRLSKCHVCHDDVDPYIESDLLLVCLDVALFRRPAFLHVIFNRKRFHQELQCESHVDFGASGSLKLVSACLALRAVCAAMFWGVTAVPAALRPPGASFNPFSLSLDAFGSAWPLVWLQRSPSSASLPQFLTSALTPALDVSLQRAFATPARAPALPISVPHLLAAALTTLAADAVCAVALRAAARWLLSHSPRRSADRSAGNDGGPQSDCLGSRLDWLAAPQLFALVLASATLLFSVIFAADPWLARVSDAFFVALVVAAFSAADSAAAGVAVADSAADLAVNAPVGAGADSPAVTGRAVAAVAAALAARVAAVAAMAAAADAALRALYATSAAAVTAPAAQAQAWALAGRLWGPVSVCTARLCANFFT